MAAAAALASPPATDTQPSAHEDDETVPAGIDPDVANVQIADSQQYEPSDLSTAQAMAGVEEAVSETQVDDERLRTSGTIHSVHSEFNDSEDGRTPSDFTQDHHADPPVAGFIDRTGFSAAPFFVRPSTEADTDTLPAFAFGTATKHQLDLVGTRKGPAAAARVADGDAVQATRTVDESVSQESSDKQPGELLQGEQVPHATPGIERAQDIEEQPRPVQPPRKKRKKRKRQSEAAPTELTDQYAHPESVSLPMDYTGAPGRSFVQNNPFNIVHASEAQEQERPVTPPNDIDMTGVTGAFSSPHRQLQCGLEAAALEHSPVIMASVEDTANHHATFGEEHQSAPHKQQLSPHPGDSTYHVDATVPLYGAVPPDRRDASRLQDTRPVTKRNPTASRRVAQLASADDPSSDAGVEDLMYTMLDKMHDSRDAKEVKFAAEREGLLAEVHQISDAKQLLQQDLDSVQLQKNHLASLLEQQRNKVSAYETKVSRFKTFVDGLGNDVDALKKDAGATRRKGEQLALDGEERKAEQAALLQQFSMCAETSAQLKDRAIRACQEAQSDLQASHFRNDYLEKELSERSGLLVEQRDRCSQLERQLLAVATSDEKVVRALNTNNDAVLDKLFEIHATLEYAESSRQTEEMVEKTFAAIQALNSQHSSNADDLITVKDTVESLSESFTAFMDANESARGQQHDAASLQTALEDAFKDLKAYLAHREKQQKESAATQEASNGLHAQLTASKARVGELQKQLEELSKQEEKLQDSNESLRKDATNLRSRFSADDSTGLSELKAELQAKEQALDKLSGQADVLRSANEKNCTLDERVQSLQQKLKDTEERLATTTSQYAGLERNLKEQEDKLRRQYKEHSDQCIAEHKMEADNKLHAAVYEQERSKKQLRPLHDEVVAQKAKAKELQGQIASAGAVSERYAGMEQQLQSSKRNSELLQGKLDDLQSALKDEEVMKEQYNATSADLTTERDQHRTTMNEKATLAKQLQDVQRSLETAQAAEAEAKARAEKREAGHRTAAQQAEATITESVTTLQRSEAGVEYLRQDCERKVEAEQQKGRKRIEALQQRLEEAQAELQSQKDEQTRFHTEVQQSWDDGIADHGEQLAAARANTTQAEAQRDDAVSESERLRQELASVTAAQADKVQASQQRPSSPGPNVPAARIRVPTLAEGMASRSTPTVSNKENEPPRPRKKLDRASQWVVDSLPVPAPEVLRPTSRAKSPESTARGPVVEESHPQDITEFADPGTALTAYGHAPSKPSLATMPSDSEDMLDTASRGRSQPATQIVAETQYDDSLPSFAAFNSVTSPRLQEAKPAGAVFSMPPLPSFTSHDSKSVYSASPSHAADGQHSFAIHEDSQSQASLGDTQSAHQQIQDSLAWTDAEKEKYSFRKAYPPPNSASKLVHRDEQAHQPLSQRSRMGELDARALQQRDSDSRKPDAVGNGRQSSSPAFMQEAASMRKKSNTYQTPATGSTKRRPSHADVQSTIPADPRLANKRPPVVVQQATKRKSGHIVEGYEHERKKRKAAESQQASASSMMTAEPSRYSLRASAAQPSIHDLPSMGSTGGSSRYGGGGTSTQSRMQTMAGASASRVRGGKKMSKGDQFASRFERELSR